MKNDETKMQDTTATAAKLKTLKKSAEDLAETEPESKQSEHDQQIVEKANTLEAHELAEPEDDDDAVVTLKDILKIVKTDIASPSRLSLLQQLLVFSLSVLVREGEYRKKL